MGTETVLGGGGGVNVSLLTLSCEAGLHEVLTVDLLCVCFVSMNHGFAVNSICWQQQTSLCHVYTITWSLVGSNGHRCAALTGSLVDGNSHHCAVFTL